MTLALVPIAAMLFDGDNQLATHAILATLSAFWFLFVVIFVFQMYCYFRVAEKCGYPGAYSLLMLIPLVNIVIGLMWVFGEWPMEAELKRLRAAQRQP